MLDFKKNIERPRKKTWNMGACNTETKEMKMTKQNSRKRQKKLKNTVQKTLYEV